MLTVAGVLSIKEAPGPSAVLLPLPLISLWFHHYCVRHMHEPTVRLPLFEALPPPDMGPEHDAYVQPALACPALRTDMPLPPRTVAESQV